MHPHGIALQTDLALAAMRGRVVDRGDYLVVRTPDDPSYYYGNLLVFPAAPEPADVPVWLARFAEELPDARHRAFMWDGPTGDTGALVEAGFVVEVTQALVADDNDVLPAPAPALPLRELTADETAETWRLPFEMSPDHHDDYRLFLRRRATWHAQLVGRGDARFWGAHDGGALVASLGLVELAGGGDLARFQDVQTAPGYRRRGLARALISAAAAGARAKRLVIVAEPGGAGERLYERAGFRAIGLSAGAHKRPT